MIGIFDSGLGGLTVVKEVLRQLPGFPILYFGDTARTPYGTKGEETVRKFAEQDTRFLMENGADIIVVACNTVSAVGMDAVRAAADELPVFDVVTPAVRAAAVATKGKVGVIGTRATVGSGIYSRLMKEDHAAIEVYGQACPLFVPLVEEGWADKPEAESIARSYLNPLRLHGIDTLILGCTHYPFLRDTIQEVIGPDVTLIDPANDTAQDLKAFLSAQPELAETLRKQGEHRFFVSDRTPHFAELAAGWLEMPVELREAKLE